MHWKCLNPFTESSFPVHYHLFVVCKRGMFPEALTGFSVSEGNHDCVVDLLMLL